MRMVKKEGDSENGAKEKEGLRHRVKVAERFLGIWVGNTERREEWLFRLGQSRRLSSPSIVAIIEDKNNFHLEPYDFPDFEESGAEFQPAHFMQAGLDDIRRAVVEETLKRQGYVLKQVVETNEGIVVASLGDYLFKFRTEPIEGGPGEKETFGLTQDDIRAGGDEPAFANLEKMINQGFNGTQFFREDALTVVIFVSTGADFSDLNTRVNSVGQELPSEDVGRPACVVSSEDAIYRSERQDGERPLAIYGSATALNDPLTCGSRQTSLNYHRSFLQAALPSGLRVYSIVPTYLPADLSTSICRRDVSLSRQSNRYPWMAAAFGGTYGINTFR